MRFEEKTSHSRTIARAAPPAAALAHPAVFAVSADWRLRYVNEAGERLLDRPQYELLGRSLWEMFPALCAVRVGESLRNAMERRSTVTAELFFRPRRAWLRVRATPLSEGLMIYTEDITHHKQLERTVRQERRRLEEMASELSEAEERERRRIAAHLHDEVGQTLLLTKLKLRELKRSSESGPLAGGLVELESLVDAVIRESRSLTSDLCPPLLHEAGLEGTLRWLADKMQREHGLPIAVDADPQPKPLDEPAAIVLFHVVRELLVNVAKHARATQARVIIRGSGGQLLVEVSDNGVGFDASRRQETQCTQSGLGLAMARQRLEDLGGTFRIDSATGRGTRAILKVRLSPRRSNHEDQDGAGGRPPVGTGRIQTPASGRQRD